MSDISMITLDGVTYDLKDKLARQQISGLDTRVDTVEGDVQSLIHAVGTPLVASTTSAMTDHNKIYVYTGATTTVSGVTYTTGHWYYWDTSLVTPTWADGGIYNSTAFTTDTTLSVSGAAADAKATGDTVDSLKSAVSQTTRNLVFARMDSVTIDSDGTIDSMAQSAVNYAINIAPVTQNQQYTLDNGTRDRVYAIFEKYPISNADLHTSRVATTDSTIVASMSGYIVLRSAIDYENVQVTSGTEVTSYIPHVTATDFEAREQIAENTDAIESINDNITDITPNLAIATKDNIVPSLVTINKDGALKINGTTSENIQIVQFGRFPAGIYTARIANKGGTITSVNSISLRYGDSLTGTRWVNNSVQTETITFTQSENVFLYVASGTTLSNYTIEITINSGSSVKDFVKGGMTAYDAVARQQIGLILPETSDLQAAVKPLSLSITETAMVNTGVSELNISLQTHSGLVFSYITDTHIDKNQTVRHGEESLRLFSAISNLLGAFSIHMGDVIQSSNRTASESIENLMDCVKYLRFAKNCLVLRGNHDTNVRPGEPINTAIFSGLAEQFNHLPIIHNPADNNKLYGYFDLQSIKTRVYIVDGYDNLSDDTTQTTGVDPAIMSEMQIEWLFGTNAIQTNGWSALVLSHCGPAEIWTAEEYISGADHPTSYSVLRKTLYDNILSYGVPMAWLRGNGHVDDVLKVACRSSSSLSPVAYVMDMIFENAFYTSNGSGDDPSTDTDKYCVGFVTFDPVAQVVNDTRIGRGNSRTWHYGLTEEDIHAET